MEKFGVNAPDMKTIANAWDSMLISNYVDKVEVHDNSEKINCLNNCPPEVIQLILGQDCLSAYDVFSASLVNHFFRVVFFSYVLKPHDNNKLPVKPGCLEEVAATFLPISVAKQTAQFLNQPDGVWTVREKLAKFPYKCLRDEFLPFHRDVSMDLELRRLGGILIKHALATKKCTLLGLLENDKIINEQVKQSGMDPIFHTNQSMVGCIVLGLIKDIKEWRALPYYVQSCLDLECVQKRLVDGKITIQAVKRFTLATDKALRCWDSKYLHPEFQEQLTFEQVTQYPEQAYIFMNNRGIMRMISKEEQENVENALKMKNDFLKLPLDSLEAFFFKRFYLSDNSIRMDKFFDRLEEIQKKRNKVPDRNSCHMSADSTCIWANKLRPVAEMITVEKLITQKDVEHLILETLLIILDEPGRTGLKSGVLTLKDLVYLRPDQIMAKLNPHPECTIQ